MGRLRCLWILCASHRQNKSFLHFWYSTTMFSFSTGTITPFNLPVICRFGALNDSISHSIPSNLCLSLTITRFAAAHSAISFLAPSYFVIVAHTYSLLSPTSVLLHLFVLSFLTCRSCPQVLVVVPHWCPSAFFLILLVVTPVILLPAIRVDSYPSFFRFKVISPNL